MKTKRELRYQLLKRIYGYSDFRPGQEETIAQLQNGQNTLAILPTGTGKTLIYVLTAYLLKRRCLIISPLLSLMQDQVSRLNQLGETKAVALNSSVKFSDRQRILKYLSKYRFIFASPEILMNGDVIKKLQQCCINFLVIDEAHCISTWGPDFRPAYLNLNKVRKKLHNPLTLALTATANEQVIHDIQKQLLLDDLQVIKYSINRPNIFLNVEKLNNQADKAKRLEQLVCQIIKPGIIYFSSKKQADEWAFRLTELGFSAASYHGDIDFNNRQIIQQSFMQGKIDIICATSAFGMGIDKNDVRFVIHYHMPNNFIDYIQEIGRAGRDGKQAIATVLLTDDDYKVPLNLLKKQFPSDGFIERLSKEHSLKPQSDLEELLQYYFSENYSVDEIKSIFKQRWQSQKHALDDFNNFLFSKNCLRNGLLTEFQEQTIEHNDHCCANLTESINLKKLGLINSEDSENNCKVVLDSWKAQLDKLFNIN